MTLRRIFSVGAALAVAAIAAAASYSHMRHLAIQYGQERWVASLLPLSVDGMLVVATLALGDGRRYRWSAWGAFWLGVTVSVVANALAAQPHVLARCISAWPAVAFLATVEVITRGGRGTRVVAAPPAVPAERPQPVPVPSATPAEPATPTELGTSEARANETGASVAASEPVPAASNGKRKPPVPDRVILAALRNRQAVPGNPDGTVPVRDVERRWGVRQDRAVRLLIEAGRYQMEPVPGSGAEPVPVNGRTAS